MPPHVKAYVKRQKNDAADAAAICEAVTRPSMRLVPVKMVEDQAALMLHRARDLLVRQRTTLMNAFCGHLAELGIAAAQGRRGIGELIALVTTEDEQISPAARRALVPLIDQLAAIDRQIESLEAGLFEWHKAREVSCRLAGIPDVGYPERSPSKRHRRSVAIANNTQVSVPSGGSKACP